MGEFEEMLHGLGYRRRSRILGSRELMTRYTHHMEFDGPMVPLDLHWVLRCHPSFALDYAAIWQDKQLVEVRKSFFALSAEYELVLQFLSIQNDVQLGVIRLKSFVDLYAILKRVAPAPDWTTFLARRAAEGLLRIAINVSIGARSALLSRRISRARGRTRAPSRQTGAHRYRRENGSLSRHRQCARAPDVGTAPLRNLAHTLLLLVGAIAAVSSGRASSKMMASFP